MISVLKKNATSQKGRFLLKFESSFIFRGSIISEFDFAA